MDYIGKTKSNYFRVTNEKKLLELLDQCGLCAFVRLTPPGIKSFAFGIEGPFEGIPSPNDGEGDRLAFYGELQKLVARDDAVIVLNIGYEGLRYLVAEATIIVRSKVKFLDIQGVAAQLASQLLANPEFETRFDY